MPVLVSLDKFKLYDKQPEQTMTLVMLASGPKSYNAQAGGNGHVR
jgi:hypothetical protein